jgi:hypothetical protein
VSYVDDVAARIRAEVADELIPSGDTRPLFRIYALLALSKGTEVKPADVHDAWVVWMLDQNPDHPSIRPFTELDRITQEADDAYVKAIRKVGQDQR